MAYVIGDFGIINRNSYHRIQTLSCMENETKKIQKELFNAECIQKRIEEAAKVRAKLDEEIAKRNADIKLINFLG